MATATGTPAVSMSADAATVGLYATSVLPQSEIRTILDEAGHSTLFSHEDPAEAVEACRASKPDVLLVATSRPNGESLKLVTEVRDASGGTSIVLICERSGSGDLRKAIDAGIRGFVTVGELSSALGPVISVVRVGQVSVPESRGGELQKKVLTAREKQILGLVVMGMTNAEIATKLFLAESTVKSHLSSAFAKLGVSSRSEAASVILDPQSGAGLGILTIPTA